MKHLISTTLLLLAMLLPATVLAYDFEVDGIYYDVNGTEATVTFSGSYSSSYSGYSGDVAIPATVTWNGIAYSVTSIGYSAFSDCSALTSVTIPNSVTSIGNYAFECCGLTSVTIGNSVTFIGDYAFESCERLTSVAIPNSVTYIGSSAFDYCSALTSVTIGNSVTFIGDYAFQGCECLTSVAIPNSVTYLGSCAFSGCSNLTSVTISNSVTTINGNVFYNCTSLASVTIPNSVTSIGYEAFYNCNCLTSVTIGNSVTSIDESAFYYCSGLTSVTIPNSVTSIGSSAFYGCSGLTTVTIGNSVTSIGNSAFSGCSSLTSVTIPNTLTSIGSSAFAYCSSLTNIQVANGNTKYDSRNNCNAIIETASNTLIVGCQSTIIPNSVTSIGSFAFSGCSSLTSMTIPNSVTTIGYFAFSDCSGLMSVTIPNSVTSILGLAFINCSGLTSVTIPSSVTYIDNGEFSGCSSLTKIEVENRNPKYDSRNNCNAIIETATNTMIAGCKSTIIPNSVTSIGEYAFDRCYSLTSETIPNSVTTIGTSAFYCCDALDDVYSYITDPSQISMGNSVFYRNPQNYAERTLHVPAGSLAAYQADIKWSQYFGNIVEMGPMVATSIQLDRSAVLMEPEENLQLTAKLQPIEAIYNEVLWGSSNPAVATVSNDGLVTAFAPGTATITAMTTDGSNLSASCIVTVYTEKRGDVDGNGLVNISDVTSLIDYLLNGDASAIVLTNADCDGSGVVNISDVTELIDYLLSGSWPVEPEPEPVITSYTANGVTFNMVEVEGGTFMMGATPEQGDEAWDKEKPVHQVTLSGYHIGETEVTQELWQAVMGENPSHHTGDLQRPVDQVSWVDCIAFISKLNQLTGKSFRLPTEAEWEYAARGGNKSEGYRYAGGNDMDVVSWYIDNSDNTTHPVATKAPNELGLYDMTGNVWEWCQDWYHRYTADDQVDPTGQGTGTNRVLRGGCWNGDANYNRISFRDNFTPTGCNSSGGLRLVLDMDNSPKFRLSETVMKVDMGGNKSVNILNGGGSYTVSGGADFVTASISGNQLTVTGNATGTTTVHVTDAATGAMAVIAVIVTENHDEVFTVNGVTFKMVTVDEGIFTMGATAEQGSDYNSNERPTHQVALSSYKIGQTEVTQELWVAVMGSNPSNFTGNLQRPVDKVSYNDCLEFISKLNQLTGKSFRLPTEAEWEFAARGGNLSQGYKYAGSNTVEDVAWYLDNSESTTHPVATKAPNELGLYDMSGNVFEWCQDWYGAYSAETQVNPTGPTSGTYRVCRGGAWTNNSSYCRVSYRSYHSMTSQYNRIGLRLALD